MKYALQDMLIKYTTYITKIASEACNESYTACKSHQSLENPRCLKISIKLKEKP